MTAKEKTKTALMDEIRELRHRLATTEDADLKRQVAEGKLRASEERYRTLTRNIPLGVYRRTPGAKGKLVMVNPALVRMFQYGSEAELNQVPVAQLYYDPDEVEGFSQKLFHHREVIREQLKMKRKDGIPIWVAVTATVICDDEGKPIYFDGIMEDITERRQAEEEAKLRQEQLRQADKMISLGILVSGVAHEINNPNQFIISHIEPLEKIWRDSQPILQRYFDENGDFILAGQKYSRRKKQVEKIFENIREGTTRIKRIVDELRDYAREQPTDLKEAVQLNDIVRSALSLLQNLIRKSTSDFFVTYGKALPPFKGDYQRIEQVVINLLQNACQAFEETPGKVSVITRYDRPNAQVIIQVNDTGSGIAPEHLARLTDPFFTTKRNRGGTGLGLSISQNIVTEHGGRLEFKSERGMGTTVKLYLPALETLLPSDS